VGGLKGESKDATGEDTLVGRYADVVQGALNHDELVPKWLARLVPRHVSEVEFWQHYISHVETLRHSFRIDPAELAKEQQSIAAAAAPPMETQPVPATEEQPVVITVTSPTTVPPSTSVSVKSTPMSVSRTPLTPAVVAVAEMTQRTPEVHTWAPKQNVTIVTPDNVPAIRWGILGVGDVCRVKSGPAFYKCTGSKLVAVMRRDEAKVRAFAAEHKVEKFYTSAEALIQDPEVDAVYIATPPHMHLEYALKVCAAGKPCLVEKPMARSFDECQLMVDKFAERQIPLYVAYYRRHMARFLLAQDLIADKLGVITSVHCLFANSTHLKPVSGWRVNAEIAGGGLFMDLGSHTLDILDFLFGEISHVNGDAVRFTTQQQVNLEEETNTRFCPVETNVAMTFRTAQNVLGSAQWNFAAAISQDQLTVHGTKGMLTMSIFGSESPVFHESSGKQSAFQLTPPAHVHQGLVQTIVDDLRRIKYGLQASSAVHSTGESALRTARVMDAVLRKYYKNRQDAFWRRPNTWGH
jgi:predicted dehydrogenase